MALADLIVIMNDGRIEQAAHPRNVFERPATAFVARFMGDHNVVSGRVVDSDDGMVTLDVAEAAASPSQVTAPRRSERRSTSPSAPTGSGSASRPTRALGFTGIVSNVEYRGSSVKLSVIGAGIEDFTVDRRRRGLLSRNRSPSAMRCRSAGAGGRRSSSAVSAA